MKISRLAISMLMAAGLFTGCATTSPVQLQLAEIPAGSANTRYGTIPVASPEHAHNALLAHYREDSTNGFTNSIRHANAILVEWPRHRYAASSAYLAGWASLWVEAQPAAERALADYAAWKTYVRALMVSSAYFERAGEYDGDLTGATDSFWTTVSSDPLAFIHEGFREPAALARLLQAQRLLKVTHLNGRDFETLKQAVITLESVQKEFPDWSRRHGVETLIQRTIAAMGVEADRLERAEEIFGG